MNTYYMPCFQPGPPPPIEPGGIYAHSPSPEPPYLGEMISKDIHVPPSWVLVTVGNYKKLPLFCVFSGILPKTTDQKYPPFRRKWERTCGPLMHSSEGPGFSTLNMPLCQLTWFPSPWHYISEYVSETCLLFPVTSPFNVQFDITPKYVETVMCILYFLSQSLCLNE